ncbi:MAG: aminotransferase class I/II-fold pyridoxal phosphate-dependent enzyme [Gemmatimonadetes bacterium]|nr:aminotransferase class I/II-fold pyridoxal phosphate-dependent enzyme [Gemmatimonadota bacterium]
MSERLSALARSMQGSQILRIAAEVGELIASGKPVCNLTVGDFAPPQFPVPAKLSAGITKQLQAGQTNYPPSTGLPELRNAVVAFYKEWLGFDVPLDGVLICAGGRPVIYGAYHALVNAGDRVVYPTPSWSNEYYTPMLLATPVEVPCGRESGFLPTAASLGDSLRGARLLIVNSPMNPAGTMFTEEQLGGICDAVLAENARREAGGSRERPLFVLFDQMYWMLTFGGAKHFTPTGLRPEMAKYTVYVDGISKSFAATGVRVGWAVGPADVIKAMGDLLAHIGAWAPRAEQLATAEMLADSAAIREFHKTMLPALEERLNLLADGIAALKREGFPVDSTPPQGAIYLSAQFALNGKRAPDGTVLQTNEDIRRYLLHSAGLAAVQFQAFGAREETGWFRLSAGAVSPADIKALMPRLREALAGVK